MAEKVSMKSMDIKDLPRALNNKTGTELVAGQTGKYEVNLVPAVKLKMIKMQKIRNVVFFICIVISVICGAVIAILLSVKLGQDVAIAQQDDHLAKLSSKVMEYEELPAFLTIQDQLDKIAKIEDKKKVLSRAFGVLAAILPSNGDKIMISELNVDLRESTFTFDAQADAVKDQIDYRVLEAFKKSVGVTNYDYGRYVDKDGEIIPTRCIIETDADGNMFSEKGNIYAVWTRGVTGCDPSREDYTIGEDGNITSNDYTLEGASATLDNTELTGKDDNNLTSVGNNNNNNNGDTTTCDEDDEDCEEAGEVEIIDCQEGEEGCENGKKKRKTVDVIPNEKIWRTPQFNAWYNHERVMTAEDGVDDDIKEIVEQMNENTEDVRRNTKSYIYTPTMTLSKVDEKTGELKQSEIYDVPHFESECISYFGTEQEDGTVKWSAKNSCNMAKEDMVVSNSSNGRDKSGNLVLVFSAVITFDDAIFSYKNKHMMIVSPTTQNVTDSFKQVENMFTAPARACAADDQACKDTSNSTGGH